MSAGTTSKGPSLQDSINDLVKALDIVTANFKKFYGRDASQVSNNDLNNVLPHFVPLTTALKESSMKWIESRHSGPDAVMVSKKLEDRIDIKLLKSGKLDFEQMKKIMIRMNRADDALLGLDRIDSYISVYRRLCAQKGLAQTKDTADLFVELILNPAKGIIQSDIERYRNQVQRLNLYFQNKLSSKVFKVAFISLLFSAIAVLLSILTNVLPILASLDP